MPSFREAAEATAALDAFFILAQQAKPVPMGDRGEGYQDYLCMDFPVYFESFEGPEPTIQMESEAWEWITRARGEPRRSGSSSAYQLNGVDVH